MENEKIELVNKYIASMTEIEKRAFEIAKKYLGQSLNIEKTTDYQKWLSRLKENVK